MTPWQLNVAITAGHERQAWLAWSTAFLTRVKKWPSFKEFVGTKKTKKNINEAEILARLKTYQKRRDKKGRS